ncbi:MAG: Lpg1974 family pore-forming outer membrane protein [Simkaniaceae bacterium]
MRFFGKITTALTAFALCQSLYGVSMEERVSTLEKEMKCVYMEVVEEDCECNPVVRSCGAWTGSARPEPIDCCAWFFTIDALFWNSHIGGTEYAWKVNQTTLNDLNAIPLFPLRGTTKDIGFNWDWGFRTGLGYRLPYDGWDLYAEFTYFKTNGSSSAGANINGSVIPLRGSSVITLGDGGFIHEFEFCDKAKARFSLDFMRLDLDLGRDFYVSPKLALKPLFGLVATWVDMKERVDYTGGEENGGLGVNSVRVKDKDYFKGVGPKFGMESDWYIGAGVSLYANLSGALVYGYHNVDHYEKFSALEDNKIDLGASPHRYAPNVLAQAGIAWQGYFDENEKHVTIQLGFDGQYWWRMNQMIKIDESNPLNYEMYSEDLGFIGLNLSFRFDF